MIPCSVKNLQNIVFLHHYFQEHFFLQSIVKASVEMMVSDVSVDFVMSEQTINRSINQLTIDRSMVEPEILIFVPTDDDVI